MKKLLLLFIFSLSLSACNTSDEEESPLMPNFVFKPVFTTTDKEDTLVTDINSGFSQSVIKTSNLKPVEICGITIQFSTQKLDKHDALKIIGEVVKNKNTNNEHHGWQWKLIDEKHGTLWVFNNSPNYSEIIIKNDDINYFLKNSTMLGDLKFTFDLSSNTCFNKNDITDTSASLYIKKIDDPKMNFD